MSRTITVGIDIGTYATRVAISEFSKGDIGPHIIGTGIAETKGLRRGYVVAPELAISSLQKALREAERNANIKVKRAILCIGGISIASEIGTGVAVISRADGQVTALDIKKSISEAEQSISLTNKKILHIIPLQYKLDSKEVMGKPEGMKGVKLEAKVLFITVLEQHFDDLVEVVSQAGVDVVDVVASPLSGSVVTLSETQKTAGCLLVDIGHETVTASVFENGALVSLHIFKVGSAEITNDIALVFRVSLEEADSYKIGSLIPSFPKKKLDDVVNARLGDIFELIENYLKKIKRNGLLPAGVIIIGGGAHAHNITSVAKSSLELPARVGTADILAQTKNKIKDSTWFNVYGLCFRGNQESGEDTGENMLKDFWTSLVRSVKSGIKQLLP